MGGADSALPSDGGEVEPDAGLDGRVEDAGADAGCVVDCMVGDGGPPPDYGVRSCSELAALDASLPSGVYVLSASTGEKYNAYCEMVADGGGWTLVLKVDGRGRDFHYHDPLWISGDLLNEDAPDFDFATAKLRSFVDVPFASLRVAMNDSFVGDPPIDASLSADYDPAGWSAITIAGLPTAQVPSARDFFASPPQGSTAGREAWRSLMDHESMQPECNQEGLLPPPTTPNFTSVRLGIRANGTSGCNDSDSVIGLGIVLERLEGSTAGNGLPIPTAGNHCAVDEASCDNGNIAVPAMGALFVR